MPVHIDEISSEVTVMDGDLPLSMPQIDRLAKLVMARIAEKAREGQSNREATQLKRQSSPPFEPEA